MKKLYHTTHDVPASGLPKSICCLAILGTLLASGASAQEKSTTSNFELGTVLVVGKRLPAIDLGDIGGDQVASVITSKELRAGSRHVKWLKSIEVKKIVN